MTAQNPEPRLLLIDDDRELGRLMSQFLTGVGFHVECAVEGLGGLVRAQSGQFDLILLDVGLPLLDGFSVLQRFRQTMQTPVIMLTSRNTVPDRLIGLNNGADDYLAKPFDPDELAARIRVVIRRSNPVNRRTLSIQDVGPIRINQAARTILLRGKQLELTAIEYELLAMLSQSAGLVVRRDTLTESIFGRQPDFFDRSLDVHVSRIRAKLGKDGKMIRTVRGEGYVLTARMADHVPVP